MAKYTASAIAMIAAVTSSKIGPRSRRARINSAGRLRAELAGGASMEIGTDARCVAVRHRGDLLWVAHRGIVSGAGHVEGFDQRPGHLAGDDPMPARRAEDQEPGV